MQTRLSFLSILFIVTSLTCNAQEKDKETEPKTNEVQNVTTAKEVTIKGKLIDSKTEKPIGMGFVIIAGTTTGAMTNEDGKFMIIAPSTAKKLAFSAKGYESKKVDIVKDKEMEVKLS